MRRPGTRSRRCSGWGASLHALALSLLKDLDGRPDAVPGAGLGSPAKTFLTHKLGVDPGVAKGHVEAASCLDGESGDLPLVGQALADGQITPEHAQVCVKAVGRLPKKLKTCTVTDDSTDEQVTGMQAVDRLLARTITDQPVRSVKHLLDRLVAVLDPDRKERFDEDAHLRRGVSLTVDSTGMGLLRATLPPADTAILRALLAQWGKPNPSTTCTVLDADGIVQEQLVRDERTLAMRQYDGMTAAMKAGAGVLLTGGGYGGGDRTSGDRDPAAARAEWAKSGSAGDGTSGTGTSRTGASADTAGTDSNGSGPGGATPPVTLLVTATVEQVAGLRGAGLAAMDRVGPISRGVLGYLTCSANLTRVLLDHRGVPVDVGRAQRLATPAQRKALAVRDGGCVIPGCTVPAAGCDAHHVREWSDGGATDLDNLVLACRHHHQQVHAGIWTVEVHNGIPWIRPPGWVDTQQRLRRNPLHHHGSAAQRLAEQLTLALAPDEDRSGGRTDDHDSDDHDSDDPAP